MNYNKTPGRGCPVLLSVTANGCNLSSAGPNKTHNLWVSRAPPEPKCCQTACPVFKSLCRLIPVHQHWALPTTVPKTVQPTKSHLSGNIGEIRRVCEWGWLQASAAVYKRSSLFRDLKQRRFIVDYRRFGTTCRSHFQMSSSLNTGLLVPKRPLQTTNPRRLTSQKIEHLESDGWHSYITAVVTEIKHGEAVGQRCKVRYKWSPL